MSNYVTSHTFQLLFRSALGIMLATTVGFVALVESRIRDMLVGHAGMGWEGMGRMAFFLVRTRTKTNAGPCDALRFVARRTTQERNARTQGRRRVRGSDQRYLATKLHCPTSLLALPLPFSPLLSSHSPTLSLSPHIHSIFPFHSLANLL